MTTTTTKPSPACRRWIDRIDTGTFSQSHCRAFARNVYPMVAWSYRLTLPAYWLAKLFEDEVCGGCGGDEDDHDVVTILGNYFARCRS